MKLKIIILILFALTLLLSVACYYLATSKKQAMTQGNTALQVSRKQEVLERSFLTGLANDGSVLSDSLVFQSRDGGFLSLKQIFGEKPILAIRISENYCDDCVSFLLNKIIRLFGDKNDKDRIVILAKYSSPVALKIISSRLSENFPIFLTEELPLFAETYNQPYCFVVNEYMTVSHVFVPDKHEPESVNLYFEKIGNRYFADAHQ